jgi:endonuclease/exonuclease/phosphatase family metal-dependent hydrolase
LLRVATYNAHDCIGRDGVYSPERIARVVSALDADIVALQEITLDHTGSVLDCLQQTTGLRVLDGALFERGVGRYGNVLLTRCPLESQTLHDLSHAGREPRGVVDTVIRVDDRPCRVMATHLGLSWRERREQIRRIAELLSASSGAAVLLGDFNVWLGSKAFEPLIRAGFTHTPLRSYPTWPRPLLPLDRIFVRAPAVRLRQWRHHSPAARLASDHYPLVAELAILNDAASSTEQ